MRVPNVNSTFNIDIEIEPTNITGRLFWDMDKDGTFSSTVDESLAITPVKATNIRSEVETIVNTNANGKYEFIGLAPGEYTVTYCRSSFFTGFNSNFGRNRDIPSWSTR